MADIARLTDLIEPEASALGFELVRVKMIGSEAGDGEQALQIMAEDPATGQLVIDQCAALPRVRFARRAGRKGRSAHFRGISSRSQQPGN